MIARSLCIAGILVLLGCQNVQRPEKPDDLIGEEKMAEIFYDAYLANAAKSINNRKLRGMGIKLDSIIYVKHDIDSVQFAKSNEYYSLDLDNYAALFAKVESRLLAQQVVFDSIKEANRNKNRATKVTKATKSKNPISKSNDPTALDSIVKKKVSTLINPIQSSVESDSIK